MAYRVFWQVPQQILCVELEGHLSLNEFTQINDAVISHLDQGAATRPFALLVDITRPCTTPRAFEQLRASQTYILRHDMKSIMVVGTDKFMRLMMLLTFNLCRPSLGFFDNIDQALKSAQGTRAAVPAHARDGG